MATIEVQLHGCNAASSGEFRYSHPRKDPVGPLLRRMIAAGVASENDIVTVKRGNTKCFNDAPVASWSLWTISDRDKGGIYRTKYVPYERETH